MSQCTIRDGRTTWTIHDIARVAGVSAKTVSRVVNQESGVGGDTRARVARIIEEVGYYPHTGARSMRSRTRDCLGITLPSGDYSGIPRRVPTPALSKSSIV